MNIGGGLQPLPKDRHDFSFGGTFGKISADLLPTEDFVVAEPLEIKDQKDSDMCTAYASASVSEDQEGTILEPSYTFARGKELKGSIEGWGLDLRTICKASVEFGFLPKSKSPFSLETNDRDFLADWNNWPSTLDSWSRQHRKYSYFTVDGQKDMFDSIRATLWLNKDEQRSILTGVLWHQEWTDAPEGIIPKEQGTPMFGHAFKVFGQKEIGGEIYLVAQLSNGMIGDKGLFYFPREVVNREFTFGAYTFKDIDPDEVKSRMSLWRRLFLKLL